MRTATDKCLNCEHPREFHYLNAYCNQFNCKCTGFKENRPASVKWVCPKCGFETTDGFAEAHTEAAHGSSK